MIAHDFTANGVRVDFVAGRLTDRVGLEIPLRAQSFAVLRYLAERPGAVVGKEELSVAVWNGAAVTDDSLVQCVRDIRRVLRDENQTLLKTVPRRGYRLDPPPENEAPSPRPAVRGLVRPGIVAVVAALAIALAGAIWTRGNPGNPAPAQPASIAVLPFDDMSAGGDLAYLGDGVAEDIIAMLARSPDVLVIARNSSFAYADQPVDVRRIGAELGVGYVLEGSVRREGDRLRIIAQLDDAKTGEHVWAERYDRAGTDPAALQDEVTGQILASLTGERGQLKRAQYRAAWGKDTLDLGEYDYMLRGLAIYIDAEDKEQLDHAARIWEEGLRKYPDSALIRAKLGWYHWTSAWQFWSDDMAADFAAAGDAASEVLARPDLSPEARRSALWLSAYVRMQRGDFSGAVQAAHDTVAMAPYDARVLNSLTDVLLADGDYDTALQWLDLALARDPSRWDNNLANRANLHRLMGKSEEAIAEFAQLDDLWPYMRLSAAIAQVQLGNLEKARARVREALAIDPDFTQTLWREGSFYSDPAILDGETAALAAAGLPK